MANATINAKSRSPRVPSGRALRREGQVPAVYYNSKRDVKYVQFENIELQRVLKSDWGLLEVNVDGEVLPCVIREIQQHPVRGNLVHLDLFGVDLQQKLKTKVPLNFNGVPKGVKEEGGMIDVLVHEIEIECLPSQIPSHLDIDVSELGIHDAIRLEDIQIEGIDFLGEAQTTLVHVMPPRIQEEEVAEDEEGIEGAEAAEPEVITEKKDEGEESK